MEFVQKTKKKRRERCLLQLFLCLLTCFLTCIISADQGEIKAKSGDDIILHCRGHRDADITVLMWRRPDLETDSYVFLFRDDLPYESYQHPSFRGRVQLRDPEMKDGDVSVILKNVTINDTGTYKCCVSMNSKGLELMNTINLKVEDSGHTTGNTWTEGHKDGGDKDEGDKEKGKMYIYKTVVVGLPVGFPLLVIVVIVALLIFRKLKSKKQNSYQCLTEKSDVK